MANVTELEAMVIRLQGDGRSYTKMLRDAEAQTKIAAKTMEDTGRRGEQSFHLSHRGIHGLSNALSHMASMKGPEEMLSSLGHASHAVGMQFGTSGLLMGAGVGIALAAVVKLNDELKSHSKEAANKAFGAVIDGSKSANVALASVGVDMLKERFKALNETLNPTTFLGWLNSEVFKKGTRSWATYTEQQLNKINSDFRKSRAQLDKLMSSPAGRTMIRVATSARIDESIAGLREENDLRAASVGLTEKEAALEKLRQDAMKNLPMPEVSELPRIEKLRQEILQTDIKALTVDFRKQALTAGMTAEQIKVYELAVRGASQADQERLGRLARFAAAMQEAGKLTLEMEKANRNYGLSAAEAAAREVDAFGPTGMGARLRLAEKTKALNDLTKEVNNFNLAMGGASKGELAFARAANPVEGVLAKYKELMEEGQRVTQENMTPLEKYGQTHRQVSELLRESVISQQTYDREMARAQKTMDGAAMSIQAVQVGSAEALAHLLEYRNAISRPNVPAPLPASAGPTGGGIDTAKLLAKLDLLIKAVQDANKGPKVELAPAGVGG